MTPLTQQLEDKKKENYERADSCLWQEIDKDVEEMLNVFFKKWCGNMSAHLSDNDENDGQRLKNFIMMYKNKAEIAILEQAIAEIKNKKVYCELCNGEDEASICKWCYHNALEDIIKKRIKGTNLQLNIAKNIQSQQNKNGHPVYLGDKGTDLTGSADISNLLQKQRQEILKELDTDFRLIDFGFLLNKRDYKIITRFLDIIEEKQQLNQPKTEHTGVSSEEQKK